MGLGVSEPPIQQGAAMQSTEAGNRIRKDLSISVWKAYVHMLALAAPLIAGLTLLYVAVWDYAGLREGFARFANLAFFIPAIVLGAITHELIHGLSWATFGGRSVRSIKFGFQLKTLTPYAHSKVPLTARVYRIGALMPALVLGALPYLVGLGVGSGLLAVFGLVFIFAAGGDLLVLWLLRMVRGEALVEDHPSRVGCYVLEQPEE
jgi:hypothetical protein